MNSSDKYKLWLDGCKDEKLSAELKNMSEEQINNAFYKDLEFGTAGLRGTIGAGSNCMNLYTVGRATQGFAQYLLSRNKTPSVAICYDSRHMSYEFAMHSAAVLAANGIKSYISDGINPTPYLSFMVRHFGCDGGIMVTASHNPAKYNGYKVYGSDGCQCTDSAANDIYNIIEKVDIFSVVAANLESDDSKKFVNIINIEKAYLAEVVKQSVCEIKPLKVVYTPLNGAGYRLVPECLVIRGLKNIIPVPEQATPNGDFTTCSYPNPEKEDALKCGLEIARKTNADLLIGTDPDCDRIGVAVRTSSGDYQLITGNEMGVLLIDFILSHKKNLPQKPVVVKTIVTTDLAARVAESYGCEVREVLTGFKYIGEVIKNLETVGEGDRFVFGYEESYGYLSGTYVRDKDAVVASMLVCEMVSCYLSEGKTLADKLEDIYSKFSRYYNKTLTFTFEGSKGNAVMKQILDGLRSSPITELDGEKVTTYIDYLNQTQFELPKSNVLVFKTQSGNGIIVRPSGTEPLIKVYIVVALGGDKKLASLIDFSNSLLAKT